VGLTQAGAPAEKRPVKTKTKKPKVKTKPENSTSSRYT